MFLFNKLIGVILGRKKNNYSAVAVINSSACHVFTVTLHLPASPPPAPALKVQTYQQTWGRAVNLVFAFLQTSGLLSGLLATICSHFRYFCAGINAD